MASSTDVDLSTYTDHPAYTAEAVTSLLPQAIVTGSPAEQVMTVILLMVSLFYVNFTNGLVLHVITTVNSLQNPQMYILAAYILADIVHFDLNTLTMVVTAIGNDEDTLPHNMCRCVMTIAVGFFLSSIHIIGYMAYERYMYFCRPLIYPRYLTKTKLTVIISIASILGLAASTALELVAKRIPVATTMTCQPTGESVNKFNMVFFMVFYIPSGAISILTLVRLRFLVSRHKAQVSVQTEGSGSENNEKVGSSLVKSVKKSIKMVSLVSGSFWITAIPAVLLRIGLFSSGVTWLDTEARQKIGLFALSRASYMLLTITSSLLNPVIYVVLMPEIRVAIYKLLSVKVPAHLLPPQTSA